MDDRYADAAEEEGLPAMQDLEPEPPDPDPSI